MDAVKFNAWIVDIKEHEDIECGLAKVLEIPYLAPASDQLPSFPIYGVVHGFYIR
jgi:hypothetical protein